MCAVFHQYQVNTQLSINQNEKCGVGKMIFEMKNGAGEKNIDREKYC
jgi:hypothetical protein